MVVVPGATVVEVTSAKQLWAVIEAGQKSRHVSATQVCPCHPAYLTCYFSFSTCPGIPARVQRPDFLLGAARRTSAERPLLGRCILPVKWSDGTRHRS